MNFVADRFLWATATKIAWREARASSARLLFVVAAVALGVGALTGVRGFSQAFRGMLLRDARKLMAADLTARQFALPTQAQNDAIAVLAKQGVAQTWITEALSMLSVSGGKPPVLVAVKAVDPSVYPFYGGITLEPAGTLAHTLQPDTVAVSDDLMVRLGVQRGDQVKVGDAAFRVVANVVVEPDRMAGSLNVGPRVLMSRDGLERTGLMVEGSRAAQRFLFRVGPGLDVDKVKGRLKEAFPEAMIVDYRETHPLVTRGLDRATIFLSLVSLIALIVGSIGVGMAMHSHLQQKLDSIAVMKSLGARSGQIVHIYVLQTLMLGLAGGVVGIAIGLGIQWVFPSLIARYFHLTPGFTWDPVSALQGLAVGLLTTLLFTVPPLISIRAVKPSLILRRDMQENPRRAPLSAIAAGGLILAGILGVVWWLSESGRVAAYFTGGFAASTAILALVASLMLKGIERVVKATKLPAMTRHGIANLYRPGNQAAALLVALSMGVMFTLTVYLIQKSTLAQFANSAPPDMPNVFLINITEAEKDGMTELLRSRAGGRSDLVPAVAMRITRVDGRPIEEIDMKAFGRRFRQTRSVSFAAAPPAQATVTQGRWFAANPPFAQVCVSEEVPKALPVEVGSQIDWESQGRTIASRVVCVYRSEAVRIGSNFDFMFNPGALEGLPVLYFAAVRMKPADVPEMQRAAFERYPTVTVINGADVLVIVQEVVDQIALVIRFVSAFAILAGAIILASSVAGTRFRRVREVVILKMLGATRRRIAAIFSMEFLVLGLSAGILGSMLATAFSWLVLNRLFQVDYRFDPLPHLVTITLTALLANAAGWAASRRILDQKPLEILRESL
ncbi:MAG: FtsX-like permease family protein [Bryobacteraceae bacterium]|nr:FtsX-like permease family protein [Bryobacteraceae bacterium]